MTKNTRNRDRPKPAAKTAESTRQPAREKALSSAAGATAAASREAPVAINPDERRARIALAAYYRAARRGFSGGSPEQDWLEAEAELDCTPSLQSS